MSDHDQHVPAVPSPDHDGSTSAADAHAEVERLAPGLPAHRLRMSDTDPRAAKRAERQVSLAFALSALATVGFVVAFLAFPDASETIVIIPGLFEPSASNFFLGLALGMAILLIGIGAIHWAKKLMVDEEIVEERHAASSPEADRREFESVLIGGVEESGIRERSLIRRTLIGAMLLLPLPALLVLRDLGPLPKNKLRETIIYPGVRIVTDGPAPLPIRPEDVPVGGLVNAIPANLPEVEEEEGTLNARAKATLMLIRLRPEQLVAQQGEDWDVGGILCFSKVCTHVGCPLGLYEQQTHHMLCPCHQSTFDLADAGNVIFGPAARSLPQLAIDVDDEGYIVAREDFTQPVGPSFWERG
jgi:quinol---cytochrome c reductase iron-sulfur subunit